MDGQLGPNSPRDDRRLGAGQGPPRRRADGPAGAVTRQSCVGWAVASHFRLPQSAARPHAAARWYQRLRPFGRGGGPGSGTRLALSVEPRAVRPLRRTPGADVGASAPFHVPDPGRSERSQRAVNRLTRRPAYGRTVAPLPFQPARYGNHAVPSMPPRSLPDVRGDSDGIASCRRHRLGGNARSGRGRGARGVRRRPPPPQPGRGRLALRRHAVGHAHAGRQLGDRPSAAPGRRLRRGGGRVRGRGAPRLGRDPAPRAQGPGHRRPRRADRAARPARDAAGLGDRQAVAARLRRRGPGAGRRPLVRRGDRPPDRRPRAAARPGQQHRLVELPDERAGPRRARPAAGGQRGHREDPVAGRRRLPHRRARGHAPRRPARDARVRQRRGALRGGRARGATATSRSAAAEASWKGAFVGGDLLVEAVTTGATDGRLFGNFPDYNRYPTT